MATPNGHSTALITINLAFSTRARRFAYATALLPAEDKSVGHRIV